MDDRIENLQLMTKSEHMTLHRIESHKTHDTKENRPNISEGLKKYYKNHDSPFKDKKHTKETKQLMSKQKSGSKHPRWIVGEVSADIIANRKFRARQRIKKGLGTKEDYIIIKK